MSAKKASPFIVPFSGLKLGQHAFYFELSDDAFKNAANVDIFDVKASVCATLNKEETFMEWFFESKGQAQCYCDRCGDPLPINFEGKQRLMVKYGESFQELDEELLQIKFDAFDFDLEPHIIDSILLHLPLRRVHESESYCNQEALKRLDNLRYTPSESIDQRWAALSELNKNKQNNGTS